MKSRRRVLVFLAAASLVGSATAQVTLSDRYEPGDESHWLIELAGEPFGHCWSRYVGEVDFANLSAHRFEAQVRLSSKVPGGTLEQRYVTELWTDAEGHALGLEFHAALSDAYSGVELTFADGRAEAVIRQGGTTRPHTVELAGDVHVLANNFVSHLELLLALDAPGPGEAATYSLFSPNVLRVLPLRVEHVEDSAEGSVYQDSLGERLTLKDGRLQSLSVPAQDVVFRRVEEPAERFSIDVPEPFEAADLEREEVIIAYDDVSLAGTITRPPGSDGPLPSVFFVSGSGGQDRNGFSQGIDVGTHEILDRLTEEGYLVLRVDDRGVGESTGPTADMSFDDLVEDARQCVLFLQRRDDVDPGRIAVIGHSEGGQTAPILAADLDLAAIVLMAAPGRNVLELAREQLLRGKRLEGATQEELEEVGRAIRDFYAQVVAGEPVDAASLPAELQAFAGAQAWIRSHAAQDPVENLRRVSSSVLVLQGAKDIQVSAERDVPRLRAALEEAGHPDFEVVVFPGLDHLFKRSEEEVPTGLEYLKTRPVDPGFLDTLAAWLNARLRPAGG